ncbi:ImmA/IrrE family metallo-endopeptidase [Brevundimonas sp. A19_0]|uniref:ImmA/IrrE family metallo-endopeptidase n=1 Tax=Brevundimonas sp. A19_0 TaxID=2821087 RepID=UPI001AD9F0EB|nr:ImmA/IrrE family metallo-endopeptidase [Brevundimonas sp. A19_0]MBO9501995.1 ImmA/IrrE family metallo-endopeptidase [Brevundimonas sp. A19_0]
MAITSHEWHSLDAETKTSIQRIQAETPVRLSSLARVLGVRVQSSTLPAGISGEIRPDPERQGGFLVRVNRHDSPKRQRFTVAHELAHFLIHRDQIGDGIKDDILYRSRLSDRREAEANRLAADLIMPADLIDEWLRRSTALRVENPVEYLAQAFNVSEQAMKIRLGLA